MTAEMRLCNPARRSISSVKCGRTLTQRLLPLHRPLPYLSPMFAARTSAVRSASRVARNFATVVDSAGIKVAAVDNGEATSSVTFLVKAGSRFENKPGVAHALQNFAFKVFDIPFACFTVTDTPSRAPASVPDLRQSGLRSCMGVSCPLPCRGSIWL
jgi:hypothetical protein